MSQTYYEQLKSPLWQRKRLQVMERDSWKCQDCGNEHETLNVHHRFYRKGAKAWEYELDELVTLCQSCHQKTEFRLQIIREVVGFFNREKQIQVMDVVFELSKTENCEAVQVTATQNKHDAAKYSAETVDRYAWETALRDSQVGDSYFLVAMLALRTRMDSQGFAFPSMEQWAKDARISVRKLRDIVAFASEAGWIRVVSANARGNGWRRHGYQMSHPGFKAEALARAS